MTAALPAQSRGVGLAGATLAHGALIALALLAAHRSTAARPLVYEVNLVAAPAPAAGPVTQAAADQPAPKPAPPPAKPKSAKAVPKKAPPSARQPAAPHVTPVVAAAPGEKPGTGHDAVTLHQEGLVFPFPDYLDNVVNAVYRRWNHTMFRPGLEARIAFVIAKDGSVADSSYVVEKHSGNPTFDEYARAAIEAVVAHHEFGPLPSGFNGISLPILFVFTQVRPDAP